MPPSTEPPRASPAAAASDTPSASDAIFYGVLNGLEAQRFVPGQRLVEVDLAQQFGVGRNSVREALQRLAADGIVDTFRHRGVAIKSLSVQQTRDVLDVAERMTGLLARSAARGIGQEGRPADAIAAALEQLRTAEQEQDDEAFGRARRTFYRALLEASGSLELRRLFPSIQMPIVYAQHRFASLQKLRLRDYRQIGAAVMDGDQDAADAAGMQHVRNVREEILRKIGGDAAGGAAA
ncbi:GntR family transcriptional regulator [Pulveribacter sp.]|uniref:GntR family transcriptional regulator n=1 Tax=Pulveribacter sp. TaxID=2678893 RepID=UPI0028B1461C|nr:GntR family transcriptional regulator [Pulveribacter sp.]